ncbi:uncharacterized protein V6R79_016960 [Siganus canaliculatus]
MGSTEDAGKWCWSEFKAADDSSWSVDFTLLLIVCYSHIATCQRVFGPETSCFISCPSSSCIVHSVKMKTQMPDWNKTVLTIFVTFNNKKIFFPTFFGAVPTIVDFPKSKI